MRGGGGGVKEVRTMNLNPVWPWAFPRFEAIGFRALDRVGLEASDAEARTCRS